MIEHRPFRFYYEIPKPVQDYIVFSARLNSITDIPLEEINRIFSRLPESEYLELIDMERKGQRYIQ